MLDMGINNLEQISECFSDKQMVRDIINAFLEDGLDDIRSLIKALQFYGIDDQQKKELALFYITNRTKDGVMNNKLRELLCDRSITASFSYQDLRKLLCYYVYDNNVYSIIRKEGVYNSSEKIVRDVEDYIVDRLEALETSNGVRKNPENKNLYRGLLYVLTSNPNIFRYRTNREIRSLIYAGLEDKGRVWRSVMTNDSLLKHRTTEEQLGLMKVLLSKPYPNVERLITDEEILSNTTSRKQQELISEYNANPNEETLRRVRAKAKKTDEKPVTAEEFTDGLFGGR